MRIRLNIVLFATFALTLALNFVLTRRPEQPNYRFLPEMADSLAYGAFASNPNFPDAKTLQAPAPGTVARGYLPLDYRATAEDAARAGRELNNPLSPNDRMRGRGQELFASFCQPCHGAGGNGDGPVAQRGFPPPPSLSADHARGLADGQIFHILTYGQGNMPPHASQLSRDERWALVVHVRSLQGNKSGLSSAPKEAK